MDYDQLRMPTLDVRYRHDVCVSLRSEQFNIHSAEVSQFAVISFSPWKDLPVHSQGHGVAPPRMHSDFLHHVVTEGSDLTGDWDGAAGQAQA